MPSPHREYAGWLPTITGHLSFGLIGRNGGDWHYANAEDQDSHGVILARHVILNTRRTARDFFYTGWPVPWIKPQIRAEYIAIAETGPADRPLPLTQAANVPTSSDRFGVLRGQLLMVPHHQDQAASLARTLFITQLRRTLMRFTELTPRGGRGDVTALRTSIAQLIADARTSGVLFVTGNFSLFRTGELRIEMDPLVADPADASSEEEREARMAKQFYYFVKDSAGINEGSPR